MPAEEPPVRQLLLLRHATARYDEPGMADRDAPLSEPGRRVSARLGAYLLERGLRPTQALCSPARRTLETFECLAARLPAPPVLQVVPELYLASPQQLWLHISAVPADVESLLVIAHNPGIGALAQQLLEVAKPRRRLEGFPPGALVAFAAAAPEWSAFRSSVSLLDCVCPAELPAG